jgi:hypothetical protein
VSLLSKIRTWAEENACSRIDLQGVDIAAEIDSTLTFHENVELLRKKYPTIWRTEDHEDKPKQLVLWSKLIPKIIQMEKVCTYRPKRLAGTYYVVENRFKNQRNMKALIEIIKAEEIDPFSLSEEEARWSGVESKTALLQLFAKWYGDISRVKWRNWFRVLETENNMTT